MFALGNEEYYIMRARTGEKAYVDFWKRIEENPTPFKVDSFEEGLERVKHEQVVLHAMLTDLKGRLKNTIVK